MPGRVSATAYLLPVILVCNGNRYRVAVTPPEILDVLGIGDRMKHKPRALSGGQQQRVAIARALVNNPAILLADEPTGNLDSENTTAVLELLSRLNQQLGQTILMITHDQEASAYAGRTIHMRDGRIL
jgi:putative ABC transport system ATP-binding protein